MTDTTLTLDSDHRICDYSGFLSKSSKRRIKIPFPDQKEGCVFVSSGFPNSDTFPIVKGQFTLRDGETCIISEDEMRQTMQSGLTTGSVELREWLIEFQRRLHNPPLLVNDNDDKPSSMHLIMTIGSTDGIGKVLDAVLDEGDSVITEEFTYACVFNTIIPIGAKSCAVKSDKEGMLPSILETVLSNWKEQTDGKRPRILYCCPSAANPTGITWSLERKREIYKIARTYGLLILEDDPYFLIQFAKPRVPSFLSLDADGRVIRLDTFTKLVSAGTRLGYMSGPAGILEPVTRHMVTTTCHPGNLSQIFILKVLQHIGFDGFLKHGEDVAEFYKQRAETAVRLAEKYLKGLAEWEVPHGGMFLWIHMLGVQDSSRVVAMASERGAIFTDGAFFTSAQKSSEYVRMSFSLNTEEDLDKAIGILASVIREEQTLKSANSLLQK